MARYCPAKDGPALYLECQECDDRVCERKIEQGRTASAKIDNTTASSAASHINRIAIVGTRTFADYSLIKETLTQVASRMPRSSIEIVSGGAEGADALAKEFAFRNHLKYTEFPADWTKHGKAAGPIRNKQIVEYIKEANGLIIAFWDGESRGTKNTINRAANAGVRYLVVHIDTGANLEKDK